MLQYVNKNVMALLLLNSIVACNGNSTTANVNDKVPSLPSPEIVKAEAPIVEAKAEPKVVDAGIVEDMNKPPVKKKSPIQGVACGDFFDKESFEETVESGKLFVASKEYFLFAPKITHGTVVRIGYIPNLKSLALFTTIVGEKKTCMAKNSLLAITLKDSDGELVVHSFDGIHTKNCGTAKKIQDKEKAVGIFPIPTNSNFFQNALIQEPIRVVYEVNNGKVMAFDHLEDVNVAEFRNGFRCAYEALGYTERMTDDLVDTRINKGE
jgi:hypothetical protein